MDRSATPARPTAHPVPPGLVALTVVAAALTGVSALRAGRTGGELLDGLRAGTAPPAELVESAVVVAVLVGAAVVGAWHALAGLAHLVCAARHGVGRRRPGQATSRPVAVLRRWAPPLVRRAAATTASATVAIGAVVAPAAAASGPPDDLRWSAASAPRLLPALVPPGALAPPGAAPTPARDTAPTPALHAQPAPGDPDPGRVRHLVVAGDTLWAIAAAAVSDRGEDPSAAAVADEWPRWYQANRDLIGPDPGLIRPGQHLVAPGTPLEEGPPS